MIVIFWIYTIFNWNFTSFQLNQNFVLLLRTSYSRIVAFLSNRESFCKLSENLAEIFHRSLPPNLSAMNNESHAGVYEPKHTYVG